MIALEFLKLLAERHLVAEKVVDKLRRQIEQSSNEVTAESVAKLLVKNGLLTADQAKRLLATSVAPPPLPAADDELGLAPDDDDRKVVDSELVDIEDDDLAPVEVVSPLNDDYGSEGSDDDADASWHHDALTTEVGEGDHHDQLLVDAGEEATSGAPLRLGKAD